MVGKNTKQSIILVRSQVNNLFLGSMAHGCSLQLGPRKTPDINRGGEQKLQVHPFLQEVRHKQIDFKNNKDAQNKRVSPAEF